VGTFTIAATPSAAAFSGRLGFVWNPGSPITITGVAVKNGHATGTKVTGTFNSETGVVTFTSFDVGTGTQATGTYSSVTKEYSGDILNDSSADVGTWKLTDITP